MMQLSIQRFNPANASPAWRMAMEKRPTEMRGATVIQSSSVSAAVKAGHCTIGAVKVAAGRVLLAWQIVGGYVSIMNTVCTCRPHRRQAGFTLIELMIVVVVLGILASIAYPSYLNYVLRGHRAAAQSEMMDIANRQQQFFLANRRYATTLTELSYSLPADVSARYTAALNTNNAATPPVFAIQFSASGAQAPDGNLGLNSAGQKTPEAKW